MINKDELPEYLKRLYTEQEELEGRIHKLEVFLDKVGNRLPDPLLYEQLDYMKGYNDILLKRLLYIETH